MQQFELRNNKLLLKVNKSPLFIRAVLFIIAMIAFAAPFTSLAFSISGGNGLKFGHFVAFGGFGLMGYYLLRISLWNTYGKETIEIGENKIVYVADYGWFKDGKKEITFTKPIYTIRSIGYEDEKIGVLVISSDEFEGQDKFEIQSVVKIPTHQLEELIKDLEKGK